MKKHVMLIVSSVFAIQAMAGDRDLQNVSLNSLPVACHITNSESEVNDIQCLINSHKLVKQKINKVLSNLEKRDLTHVLNTKALELGIQQKKCNSLVASKLIITDCLLQADLSLLRYIEDRYHEK